MSTPVALAHDYLTQRGGAERVVLAMSRAFPEAPIYTTLYEPESTFPEFAGRRVVVSPLNHVPPLRKRHRAALPLLPIAASCIRIEADVILASSSGWAHGFRTRGTKIVYCHNPARWLYQQQEYLGGGRGACWKALGLTPLRPPLLRWDRRAAASADLYLANSTVVRDRIRTAYGIEAQVLHPPGGIDPDGPQSLVPVLHDWDQGYHLVVSRLLPYKNVDRVVRAFTRLEERLVVVGDGPEAVRLRAMAPDNVRMVAGLSDPQMRWVYANATALVAPSHEDFGLTPLEAGSFGKPVIALRAGGYLDTVSEGISGVFFDRPTPEAIRDAVAATGRRRWDPGAIGTHVDRFSEARFADRLRRVVDQTR